MNYTTNSFAKSQVTYYFMSAGALFSGGELDIVGQEVHSLANCDGIRKRKRWLEQRHWNTVLTSPARVWFGGLCFGWCAFSVFLHISRELTRGYCSFRCRQDRVSGVVVVSHCRFVLVVRLATSVGI